MHSQPAPSTRPPPVPQAVPNAEVSHSFRPVPDAAAPPSNAQSSLSSSFQPSLQPTTLIPSLTSLTNAALPSTATATAATFASTKNTVMQRKVARLLDITTSSDIKDVVNYVDEMLPGYFNNVDADGSKSDKVKGDAEAASASSNAGSLSSGGNAGGGSSRTITSTTLRTALNHRTIDMHKNFLQEFTAVYQNFQRVAARVNELQEKCTGLEAALSTVTGGSASAADDFFYEIQMHQAELQLVQHHEKEIDDFRKQHHFGPTEQQVLEEGPVDMNFLNVLERVREVHRRSSELMQSQEYHQGAAAAMESTYTAIAGATEKIARHLLATAGPSSGAGGAAAVGRGDAGTAATNGGVGAIAADVPEVTGFQLRCVRLLYEESPSLHEKFMDEVARLRRASVLRRYFHLLTTGSANTASGMYQSGGRPRANAEDKGDAAGVGMGARPLEAELNNPTYFFSSLCAWLHQTIVEEQDFLHTFFMNDEVDAQASHRRGGQSSTSTTAVAANVPESLLIDSERVKQVAAHQQALLDSVFGGVCKHIRAALDNVLERLGRSASALGSAKGEGQGWTEDGMDNAASERNSTASQKGPRGLTGGLTRLFMAATGRSPLGRPGGSGSDTPNTLLQRYTAVTTRAQLETVASSLLYAPLHGVQTCVTLVQLFEYYSVTTFTPLLGENSALTKLISETAPQQTREVFQRLLRVLAAHLLDSTAGVVHRTATLRRLASSNALNSTVARAEDASFSKNSAASTSSFSPSTSSMYILNFLTSMTYGENSEGGSNTSASGSISDLRTDFAASVSSTANAKFRQASDGQLQRHSAQDLKRVLAQLILPPSPEVEAYCSVLKSVLADTARQADLLQAIFDQQHAASPEGVVETTKSGLNSTGATFHLRTEVKGFVQELLHALWKAAQSVQEDATLRANLDDPCRAILQYNILYQLQAIMELHGDVLDLLCGTTDSNKEAESAESANSGDVRNDVDMLRAEVGATMNALRRQLLSQWVDAVVHFYFPLSTDAVVAKMLATTTVSSTPSELEEQRHMTTKKDMRRALKQVVNVYNTIASIGHLPEPVPLLPLLCGSEKVRKEVSVEITKNVVERVYPAHFSALQKLPPTEELAAVQAEMSPQNLAVLVDFSSPSTAAV